jgi:hypothetical protein
LDIVFSFHPVCFEKMNNKRKSIANYFRLHRFYSSGAAVSNKEMIMGKGVDSEVQ